MTESNLLFPDAAAKVDTKYTTLAADFTPTGLQDLIELILNIDIEQLQALIALAKELLDLFNGDADKAVKALGG